MRRSHTVRNTRSSLPSGPQTTDDLGVLQEGRPTTSNNMDSLEASLRSEIFEKERENDRVRPWCDALAFAPLLIPRCVGSWLIRC